ncbi:MAG TPA: Nramp family divalent metal transporter [Chloroflexota bacterium]|nr:Nramp family divalent metal transporter [Chloroflexota bacterium]
MLRSIGPGLITGASDNDPSGIGTYSVVGASFGFSMLWLSWFTLPLVAAVQNICARIGQASGKGLTTVVKQHYPRWIVYAFCALLLVANTITIGADLGAMAAGVNLLTGISARIVLAPIAVLVVVALVLGRYRAIENVLRWLVLFLLAYVIAAFLTHPSWPQVALATFTPQIKLDPKFISTLVAVLGTTITPYMWIWQTSQEVEEEVEHGEENVRQRRGTTDRLVRRRELDVNLGCVISNVVMFFIMLVAGAELFAHGKHDINSAADAAQALAPLAGGAAKYLFGIGFIGMGLLAIPVLAGSSAYSLCETFDWPVGLGRPLHRVPQFYLVIALATLVGMLLNFTSINPIDALVLASAVNGLIAPFILAIIMLAANHPAIMAGHPNGRLSNVLGWLTTAVMGVAAIALLATWGH